MPRMTSNSTSSKQTRFAKNILPSKISGHCRHALLVTKLLVEGIVIRPHGGNTAITTSDAHIRSHLYYHNPQSLTTPKLEYHGNDTPNHTGSNIKHLITQISTQPHTDTCSKPTQNCLVKPCLLRKQLQLEVKLNKTQKQLWFLNRSSDTKM